MQIDKNLFDNLTEQAKCSERLRMNFDLRNSADDLSQRMLNAMEPGTVLPIHRHRNSSEVVIVVRGAIRQYFYDDKGNLQEAVEVRSGSECPMVVVPTGTWHKSESLESGTIIFEAKDGAYKALSSDDIWNND